MVQAAAATTDRPRSLMPTSCPSGSSRGLEFHESPGKVAVRDVRAADGAGTDAELSAEPQAMVVAGTKQRPGHGRRLPLLRREHPLIEDRPSVLLSEDGHEIADPGISVGARRLVHLGFDLLG